MRRRKVPSQAKSEYQLIHQIVELKFLDDKQYSLQTRITTTRDLCWTIHDLLQCIGEQRDWLKIIYIFKSVSFSLPRRMTCRFELISINWIPNGIEVKPTRRSFGIWRMCGCNVWITSSHTRERVTHRNIDFLPTKVAVSRDFLDINKLHDKKLRNPVLNDDFEFAYNFSEIQISPNYALRRTETFSTICLLNNAECRRTHRKKKKITVVWNYFVKASPAFHSSRWLFCSLFSARII